MMRLLPVLFVLCVTLGFVGCSENDPGEVAGKTAKQYYDYLLEGKYEAWVDGHYHSDTISNEYREQLIVNAKMFMLQQNREHEGIREVRVSNSKADTAHHTANVFMVFVYGDSTNEETLVPMVEHKGLWYMR
ncbi:MAG: hypothetical protein IJS97_03760 [Prevotella sp.]|nr:hypothetical protein [Prevotella sp.]